MTSEQLSTQLDDLAIEMDSKQNSIDFPLLCIKQRELRAALVAAVGQELLEPLKAACDRAWGDETPPQIVAIAANAIVWRDREIGYLRTSVPPDGANAERIRLLRAIDIYSDEQRFLQGVIDRANRRISALKAQLAEAIAKAEGR